jgi:hypothetical protein
MREWAISTHAIPVNENFSLAEDHSAVVQKIISLMSPEKTTNSMTDTYHLPPVFTLDYRVERVDHRIEDQIADDQKILNNLFEVAGGNCNAPIVYNINHLFCAMWRSWVRHGGNSRFFPEPLVDGALQTKLEEDMFAYECSSPDSCDFHGALENLTDHYIVKYCSLCICKRYVYVVCHFLTENVCINTTCIAGKHKPALEDSINNKEKCEEIKLKNAIAMAVLKEYKNPISGIELPRGGTMNGTTFLPQDKDPAIAIKEQLKHNMQRLKIEEAQDLEDQANFGCKASQINVDKENYGSEYDWKKSSQKSDRLSSKSHRTVSRRLWARFSPRLDQEQESNYQSEAQTGTIYQSYVI